MKAGVKVYLYKAGFNHSKLLVADDSIATIGSTNVDFRSFENDFEANAFFYDKENSIRSKGYLLKRSRRVCFLRRCAKPYTSFFPTTIVGVNGKALESTVVKVGS